MNLLRIINDISPNSLNQLKPPSRIDIKVLWKSTNINKQSGFDNCKSPEQT